MHFIHPPILQRIIDSMGRFTWMQGCLKLLLPPTAWGPYRSAHEEGWPRPTSCRTALEMKLPFGNTSPPNYTLQKVTVHGTYQVINEAENIDHFSEILGTSMHLYIKFRDSKRTCLQVPRSLAPIEKDHLRPKSTVYISTNNHLGWELGGTEVLGVGTGDRGLRLGEVLQWINNHLGWELGGTGVLGVGTGDRGLRLGDVLQWTNNHLGWELVGTGVLGVATGDRGLRLGDVLQWTNNPLGWELVGTGVLGVGTGNRGLIHGDVLQWTNNPLGWELVGTGVLGVATGDRGLRLGDVLQWTNNPLGWELVGTGVLGVGTGDRGLRLGEVLQWTNNLLGWELGGGWGFRMEMFYNEQTTL